MRRVVFAVVIGLALVVTASASATLDLGGKYTTKIAAPAQLKGTWGLSFTGYPKYVITQAGKVVVRGHYATVGNHIQFNDDSGPLACKQFGAYTITLTKKTISFKRQSDPCPGRSLVLGHRFTRASGLAGTGG
ncbi:MAG TPA: hypothetical protein VGF46_00825 [Gaiellales bacterium]